LLIRVFLLFNATPSFARVVLFVRQDHNAAATAAPAPGGELGVLPRRKKPRGGADGAVD
jgi:hypothetical protein